MSSLMSVKMSRFDNSPWGFRLQGGKDFAQPLVIQKVAGGSLAEKAGLQAGDALIRVNSVEVFNLRHKEAQDAIVRAGNNFELTVQRGGGTWKPQVTPVGSLSKPNPSVPISNVQPVTKTSLAAKKPVNGTEPTVKAIVNKQYNTPVGMYSEETIAETLSAQAEVLAGGVLGVNFKKNERNYDAAKSEVFKMLQEIDKEPHEPEAGSSNESDCSPPCVNSPDSTKSNNLSKTNYIQSQTFLKLQAALDDREDGDVNAGTRSSAVYPLAGLRHVSAPAPSSDQSSSPIPKTSLPPGQNICADCERLIVGVFVRIKDKNLHVECFKCATCGTSLKNVGYYNINNKLYCDIHAKLVARHHPPAPNLEPVTVPPGGKIPAGAISSSPSGVSPGGPGTPAPLATAPLSPQPGTMAPLPFHLSPAEKDTCCDSTKLIEQDKNEFNKFTLKSHETGNHTPENESSKGNKENLPGTEVSKVSSKAPENSLSSDIENDLPDHSIHKEYQSPTASAPKPFSSVSGPSTSVPRPTSDYVVSTLRDSVEKRDYPHCESCGNQIPRGPFITALGKTWCPDHFVCVKDNCRRHLQDIGFVEEQGQLYCEYCFEKYLAPSCTKCNSKIKGDCLNAIGQHFHPECFACAYCGKLFGNNPFFLEDGLPYCEADWNELFTTKCFACGFPIEAGDRWVEALNNNYHSQCFNCSMCKKNLEGQSFYAKSGRPYCKNHAR